ncbi:MAG: hypothetical protein Q7S65_04600 [Nanoarchaeota archaeon]|nr:hypothetical protein [Nanoarchaeota archaeon]
MNLIQKMETYVLAGAALAATACSTVNSANPFRSASNLEATVTELDIKLAPKASLSLDEHWNQAVNPDGTMVVFGYVAASRKDAENGKGAVFLYDEAAKVIKGPVGSFPALVEVTPATKPVTYTAQPDTVAQAQIDKVQGVYTQIEGFGIELKATSQYSSRQVTLATSAKAAKANETTTALISDSYMQVVFADGSVVDLSPSAGPLQTRANLVTAVQRNVGRELTFTLR